MKDTEIHNGLDKKEVRDFLSKTLVEIWQKTCEANKMRAEYKADLPPHEYNLNYHLVEAEKHTKLANLSRQTLAVLDIIESSGWEKFDVSDQVYRDNPDRLYYNFIGTKEEHDERFKEN